MPSYVEYRVLIKSKNGVFKLAKVSIQVKEGTILYFPSQDYIMDSNYGVSKKQMNHFKFGASGRVHNKTNDKEKPVVLEWGKVEQKIPSGSEVRDEIRKTGFQDLIWDTVKDFSKLPVFNKKIEKHAVVLDVGDYLGPIHLRLSIVSGHIINKINRGDKVPVKNVSQEIKKIFLAQERRALGKESGNSDKILQHLLVKYIGDTNELKTGRGILVPKKSGITILPNE